MYSVAQNPFGRFYIRHPVHPGLAWSGAQWVQHSDGLPIGQFQICNFDTEDDADDYATNNYLFPRRDQTTDPLRLT